MSLYVQSIGDFKTNENKINNLDNENTYEIKNGDKTILEITGKFWGLRKLKLQNRPHKSKGIHFVQNLTQNTTNLNTYNNIQMNDYLLLGDIKSGYNLYKIRCKFLNSGQNLFDDTFNYCFQLQQIDHIHLNNKELLECCGIQNFKRQGISNFTTLYNKYGMDLINYHNNLRLDNMLN